MRAARWRLLAIVCGLALITTGCLGRRSTEIAKPGTGKYGNGVVLGGGKKISGSTATSRGTSSGAGTSAGTTGGAPAASAPVTETKHAPETINDDAGLGASAYFYLNASVPKLIVEIDAVQGEKPSRAALDMLKLRLTQVVDKPQGIVFLPVQTFDEHRDSWTIKDLVAAERRHRDHRSTKDAVVLYILAVDGEYADASNALGVSYKASTYAVFEDQVRNSGTVIVSSTDIEESVFVHEAGHILALVNITYHSPRNHEDPAHPGHSSNTQSVMYWAVDTIDVVRLLGGHTAPPTDFDKDDKADLADLKSGKLG